MLAVRRLERARLQARRDLLCPSLRERLGDDLLALGADDLAVVGMLTTQWDVLLDIAHYHGNASDPVEAQLELLTLMALGLQHYALAQSIHQARLAHLRDQPVPLERWTLAVEAKLAPRGRLPAAQAAASVGMGLALLEARALAEIGSLYYASATIEEEAIAELHALSAGEKARLIEVLVALAWADGRIAPEERRLIGHQIELAGLDRKTAQALLARLDRAPAPGDPLASLEGATWDPHSRRFVLEQAVLLSLVDDDQAEEEVALVSDLAQRLGAAPGELDQVLVEVDGFYWRNRELIRDFGPVSGALARLHQVVIARAQAAIRTNMRKIVQEIRETGELARLLGAASVRELTPEEGAKVKAQLLDVCKTIPALAIFVLPGGGLLLPVLIKLLPFNILPTAFGEPEEVGGVEPKMLPPPREAEA